MPITRELNFHDRLWQKFSLKVENSAHNWYRQHVNSLLFIDEPSISPLGAAVQLLFSLPPVWAFLPLIWAFRFQHFSTGLPSKSYFIFVSPCLTACVDLPLPFGQFSTFLRPICHFPSPNLSLPFSAFFNRISLRIIFHICFPVQLHVPNWPLSFA